MNETKEALQIWSALKPMITKTIDERTKSCVRSKKMVVVTAPNGSTIGVREPFDTVTFNIPYSSAVSSAIVGDTVWAQWYFDNASTMLAVSFGDGSNSYSFPLSIQNGGTGASNVSSARDNLGMANGSGVITYTENNYISDTYASSSYRRGSMCTAILNFQKSTTATGNSFVKIGSLPSGYLPAVATYMQVPIQSTTAAYMVSLELDTNGDILMYGNNTQSGRVRASICYPLRSADW